MPNIHEPLTCRIPGQGCDVRESQFLHQMLTMILHRLRRNHETRGDLFRTLAFRNELENLPLAFREHVHRSLKWEIGQYGGR